MEIEGEEVNSVLESLFVKFPQYLSLKVGFKLYSENHSLLTEHNIRFQENIALYNELHKGNMNILFKYSGMNR